MNTNVPSNTITATFITSLGITLLFAVLDEIFKIQVSSNLSNLAVGFGSSLVGYFWPEKRYAEQFANKDITYNPPKE